jgi:hypothetical protein
MRIRRTVIAPLILTIGTIGSLVAAPAVAAMTSTTQTVASGTALPDAYVYHA